MKLSPYLCPLHWLTLTACCISTSCSMPPRDAWRIVQRDGLLTYSLREYNPTTPQSRYMQSTPLLSASQSYTAPRVIIPYRHAEPKIRFLETRASHPTRIRRDFSTSVHSPRRYQAQASIPPASAVRTPRETPRTPSPSAVVKPVATNALPYGSPAPGRPGMVTSPFARREQLVDVSGLAVGDTVKCPYSGKLFRVPPQLQALSKPSAELNQAVSAPE